MFFFLNLAGKNTYVAPRDRDGHNNQDNEDEDQTTRLSKGD